MPHVPATVPEPNLILCEGCGYVLSGLGGSERCPECGKPVIESDANTRHPSDWERHASLASFIRTTLLVLFQPSRFFRSLAVRKENWQASRSFAIVHFAISGVLLGVAWWLHVEWYLSMGSFALGLLWVVLLAPCIAGVLLTLYLATELGGHLTAWEAAYRGLRLPLDVVRRAMRYHSAHYLPVALLTFATIAGYRIWAEVGNGALYGAQYLYALCIEIVLFAAYLFKTYWIGMRNVMYANG